ncbi:MAG: RES family NAD+ phosphorylase [Deltaproteobacteria bacterium]|nr:RES family NAD+ phosphorylase [Deltaproteobacteria bacterium]
MNDVGEKMVCSDCIGNELLKEEVQTEGTKGSCSYCGKKKKGILISDLAEKVESVIDDFFQLTDEDPTGDEFIREMNGYMWERSGEEVNLVIQEIAEIEEEIAEDVRDYLELKNCDRRDARDGIENPFSASAHYEHVGPDTWYFKETWSSFKRHIRTEARYFSRKAEYALRHIFYNLTNLVSVTGEKPVRVIEPGEKGSQIYRARMAESDHMLKTILSDPTRELGPPPSRKARSGRMNASGISVFYGGMNAETCIAEIRPPVGSQVVVGKFEIIKPIHILNFKVLEEIFVHWNYFDPDLKMKWGSAVFFEELVKELTRPIMPSDEEFEYLPTQVVAEFLAQYVNPKLDGMIFRSSQTNNEGENVVLFQHASIVEQYILPPGCKVSIDMGQVYEDEVDDSISIYEAEAEKTNEETPSAEEDSNPLKYLVNLTELNTLRLRGLEDQSPLLPPTLRLDVKGIEVFRITAAKYTTENRSVQRIRFSRKKYT